MLKIILFVLAVHPDHTANMRQYDAPDMAQCLAVAKAATQVADNGDIILAGCTQVTEQ